MTESLVVHGEAPALYRFQRNLVVVASAGTGKTHALVGLLIHLALGACETPRGGLADPIPLDRIVATTFSRKAAAEIRARLLRELVRLAKTDATATYAADLRASCLRVGAPCFDDHELAVRAERALDGFPRARIGTLHGFASTLIRASGFGGERGSGFEIETEEDARDRARDAVEHTLGTILKDDTLGTSRLLRLAGGVGPLVERAAELLGRLAEDGRGAASLTLPEGDASAIESTMERLYGYARALREEAVLGASARAFCNAWTSGSEEGLEETAMNLFEISARGRTAENARAFFEFRAGLPGATHAERGRNLIRVWKARRQIGPQAALMKALLVGAENELRGTMTRDCVLSYGELLRAARDFLASGSAAAREVGTATEALLIDEFQDSSRAQRDIVELFWEDHAAPRVSEGAPRIARVRRHGLLVVGDRKQSIYGFRGADVGSFAELCVGLAGRPARDALRIPPGRVWEPEEPIADFVALRHNRRSAPEILSFVNDYSRRRLVASSQPAELYEIEYSPEIEDLSPPADADWVPARAPRVTWIRLPLGSGLSSPRASEAEAVVRRIRLILSTGRPQVRGLAPTAKDIAVLAHRNGMLEATAYALGRAGVPYVVAGNGFFSAREVKDMLAMLSVIVDPEDVLARASVLRGVWCAASDQTMIGSTDPHAGVAPVDAWEAGARRELVWPEDKPRLEALKRVIVELRSIAETIGPAETLRHAVKALSFEETLILLPRGEQRVANVRKVLALAEREPSARTFLVRMNRATDEERAEPEAATFSEDEDAVRLLTVHASKGLDFPIVILPEAGATVGSGERSPIMLSIGAGSEDPSRLVMRVPDEDGRPHDTPSFVGVRRDVVRRELAERARLAYVAATRAREAVVYVGDRRIPKGELFSAYASTAAATLAAMVNEGGSACLLSVQDEPDEAVSVPPTSQHCQHAPAPTIIPATLGSAALTALEVADFAVCPRRFQLARILRLPESDVARSDGGLASAATAPGGYEARALREGAHVERDRVYLARARSNHGVSVAVTGTIDLWIERPVCAAEAILLAPEPHGPSLRSTVLAELAAYANRGKVRVGMLTRPPGNDEPFWYSGHELFEVDVTEARILSWTMGIARARRTGAFERAPVETCRSITCGYLRFCHPGRGESD